jgi:hypothetical protein
MPKSDYLNQNDAAFGGQLTTFKTTIGSYSVLLEVSAAQVTAQAADADYFNYVLACRDVMQHAALQWTGWKNLMRSGGAPPPSGAPVVAPVFPPVVPAVAPGIEARFRALVKQIKASANYNPTIGQALGIEGSEQTGPDLATIQPDLTAIIKGTHVELPWGWGGFANYLDQLEMQVDRSDGKDYVLLAIDTTPGYTDTTPFPATSTIWTYRAIYRVGDSRVGQWSKPVSVTVGG